MLARLLLRNLIIEILLYLIGGLLLWRYADWSPGSVILLVLALSLGLRWLSIVFLFVLAWRYRTPRSTDQQLGWGGALRLFVTEWAAGMALFWFFHLLEPWLGKRDAAPADATGTPVLLIHGYLCNAGYWRSTVRYLRRQGLANVHTLSLEPIWGDIDHYAVQVAERVEALCADYGVQQVLLVGHSMGGLVARAYLRQYGDRRRLAGIITLGAPHHGSIHARFLLIKARNVQQLTPDNSWLARLNAGADQAVATPIVSLYSLHDDMVTPQDSAVLDGPNVRNVAVVGVGHLAMAFDRSIHALLVTQVEQLLKNSNKTLT